jgi:penicillin-binding protein 1B
MRSLNVATVKLAESIGYDTVVSLARRAGLNSRIRPTPAVALGAYEVTPVEIAGAYTIFANQGVRLDPYFLAIVRSRSGALLDITYPRKTPVLDPAVAFLMTHLMEDVINGGTGIGVRARGFTAPAAGKTGTSHDGWFAGYTSNLICLVWVGYDSNKELPLSGAASALPIWTEFMKRAITIPEYSNVSEPVPPPGIVQVLLDPETGELATPHCPKTEAEYFLEGTQPGDYCRLHYLEPLPRALSIPAAIARATAQTVKEFVTGGGTPSPPGPDASAPPAPPAASTPPAPQPEAKRPGFFGRIFGIFGGGSDTNPPDRQ